MSIQFFYRYFFIFLYCMSSACFGDVILASSSDGTFLSEDSGVSFSQISNLTASSIYLSNGLFLFGKNYGGVEVSFDNGKNWGEETQIQTGLTIPFIVAIDGKVYVGTGDGLYRSSDKGKTWNKIFDGDVDKIASTEKAIIISAWIAGQDEIFWSQNDGDSWLKLNFDNMSSFSDLVGGGSTFVISDFFHTWLSNDNGLTWGAINPPGDSGFTNGLISGNRVFLSTPSTFPGLSIDGGINWNKIPTVDSEGWIEFGQLSDKTMMFAITAMRGVFASDNLGLLGSWGRLMPVPSDDYCYSISDSLKSVAIGCDDGIYFSSDDGKTWSLIKNFGDPSFSKTIKEVAVLDLNPMAHFSNN